MDKSTEHSETARFLSHESVDGVDDLHDIETTYRFHNAPDRYNDSRKSTVSQSRFMLRYVLVFLAGTVFGTAILYLISTIFTRRHQEYYYNNDSNSGLLGEFLLHLHLPPLLPLPLLLSLYNNTSSSFPLEPKNARHTIIQHLGDNDNAD